MEITIWLDGKPIVTSSTSDGVTPANDTEPMIIFSSGYTSTDMIDAVWLIPPPPAPAVTIAEGDKIQAEFPADNGPVIYDVTWPGHGREQRRVWHNGQELNATDLRSVKRDGDGLEIVTGSQRAHVAPDNESAPGMFSGTVEKVEGL